VLSWPREQVLAWIGGARLGEHAGTFPAPVCRFRLSIAGTALAVELLEQVPEVRRVVVAVGGGGLAAGIGSVLHDAGRTVE